MIHGPELKKGVLLEGMGVPAEGGKGRKIGTTVIA